jgi:flagellar motor switch protein FliM
VDRGGSSGADARSGGRQRRRGGPQRYDFRRPNKLTREHVRALQIANETFARQFTTILTTTLRAACQVSLISVEQLSYDEYVGSLGNPTLAILMSIEPLSGVGILEFSLTTAMAAIDHLLGGPGGPQPTRPPTEIEATLLRSLISRVFHELRYAFEPLVNFDPQLVRFELNPQFAGIAAPSEIMIVTSFELRIGAEETVATLCLPHGSFLATLDEITKKSDFAHGRDRATKVSTLLTDQLGDVPVNVDVRFDPVRLTSGQILELAPGDVLRTGQRLSTPLSVTADGVVCAKAVPGSSGRRLAIMIVDPGEARL